MAKLTAIQVKNAKKKNKPYKLTDGHGMHLHITPTGKKTWRYRFKVNDKESTLVIGGYPELSLADARAGREQARALVKEGINPALRRKAKKQAVIQKAEEERIVKKETFEFIAMEWIEQQSGQWSKEHKEAVIATLKADAFPLLGGHRVDSIKPPMVMEVIKAVEARGALEIARKVLQRTSAVFRYAVQSGLATTNPASDMQGVLKSREVKHMNFVEEKDMPAFLQKLSSTDLLHVITHLALKFTVLTGARTGEVRGAVWSEIDLPEGVWVIPAERMKMKKPHTVFLSRQAIAILERVGKLYGQTGFIFPGIRDHRKQLSENTLLYAMYRLGYHGNATVHGFRSTFSSIANEHGFNPDVVEKALAHEGKDKVRAAYHRSEYIEHRKEMMQWYADRLDSLEAGGG